MDSVNSLGMEPAVILKHTSKAFPETPEKELKVLEDITFKVHTGEFFVVVGPSGSGKSTLLRIMSGLEKEFIGERTLGSRIQQSDMSFVFQRFALLPWLTVFENVALGLVARGVPQEKQKEIVSTELKQFGLEKFSHAYPRELSGGMRQRVGLARALAVNPKVIFMDEPFSELDSFTAEELRKELLHIWHERKITIVMVTHLIEESLELADRIAILTPRPGRIEKIIVNHLPRPRDKRSQEFYRLEDQVSQLIRS